MQNFIISIIVFCLFSIFSCKKEISNQDPAPQVPELKKQDPVQKMCVSTRSGLKVRETPSLKGKEFETLAYQTEVRVIRFGAEEKISGKEYPWALIEYKGESAWVYSGYLKVDCTEFDESYATPERISESDVEGDWKPEKNSEYYISIYVGGTFSANFFGGCDGDGCISAGASGKWEIKDNKIYFFNPGSDSVYVYWINDRRLIASDSAHSFKENYNSETISGWERY